MKNSVREVGEYKKKLLSMLKKAPEKGAEDGHEWLCDNAVLLAGCLDGWREFCRTNRKTDVQRIFGLCRKAAKDGVFPDKVSLCALLSPLSPTAAECEAFLPALRAGYAAEAVNAADTAGKTAFCVKSVRALAELDEEELLPEVCETEKTLLADPAGIYGDMAAYTKREYRLACARKAAKDGVTEKEAAAEAISKAKNAVNGEENHVGFFLPLNEKKRGAKVFIFFEFFLSAVLCLLFAGLTETPWLLLITPLPVYAFVRTLGGIVSAKLFPPRRMFSLAENYIEGEIESWRIPSKAEAQRLKSLYNEQNMAELNQVFRSLNAAELLIEDGGETARYLCENGTKTFSFRSGTTISNAGSVRSDYRMRLVHVVTMKKTSRE